MLSACSPLPDLGPGSAIGMTTLNTSDARSTWAPLTRSSPPRVLQRPRQSRSELSHDVYKPSSRTTLNGEQPYPWTYFSPRCDQLTSRCQTPPSIWNSWRHQLLSPSTFIRCSHGPSIQNHRITMTCFKSAAPSRSQSSWLMPLH